MRFGVRHEGQVFLGMELVVHFRAWRPAAFLELLKHTPFDCGENFPYLFSTGIGSCRC